MDPPAQPRRYRSRSSNAATNRWSGRRSRRRLLVLIGRLRLLSDLVAGRRVRSRSSRRKRRLRRSRLRRRWSLRQSALALLLLQIAQTLVDRLAHVVLHVLQIVKGHRHRVRLPHSLPPFDASTTAVAAVASGVGGAATSMMSPWLTAHSAPASSTRSRLAPAIKHAAGHRSASAKCRSMPGRCPGSPHFALPRRFPAPVAASLRRQPSLSPQASAPLPGRPPPARAAACCAAAACAA